MQNSTFGMPPQQLPSADLNLGSTSTSERVFVSSANTSGLNPVASQAIQLWVPTGGQLAGTAATTGFNAAFTTGNQGAVSRMTAFKVTAIGRVVTSGTLNWTVKIHFSSTASRTAANSTIVASQVIATSGTVSLASLTTHWKLEAHLIYDAVSQRLDGYFGGQVHTTTLSPTTITNPLTALDLNSTSSNYCFQCAGTFGTGNAANTAFLDQFYLTAE